jgi:hypothetical protein
MVWLASSGGTALCEVGQRTGSAVERVSMLYAIAAYNLECRRANNIEIELE